MIYNGKNANHNIIVKLISMEIFYKIYYNKEKLYNYGFKDFSKFINLTEHRYG